MPSSLECGWLACVAVERRARRVAAARPRAASAVERRAREGLCAARPRAASPGSMTELRTPLAALRLFVTPRHPRAGPRAAGGGLWENRRILQTRSGLNPDIMWAMSAPAGRQQGSPESVCGTASQYLRPPATAGWARTKGSTLSVSESEHERRNAESELTNGPLFSQR